MNNANQAKGHGAAVITIIMWGITFISTKILLSEFNPIEILFYRIAIGYLVLLAVYPRRLKGLSVKQELLFLAAGASGVTLYFLLENSALTYTTASNAGVIVSAAPFFTALAASRFLGGEKPKPAFFIGFLIAMLGIVLISFNGSTVLSLNPIGDLLALLAAMTWAVYSVLAKKISDFGCNTIQTTRRIFFYGLICMLPVLLPFHFEWGFERFTRPVNIGNMLFLGLGASALCFVTWNFAVRVLGAVKTSIYIYLVPVITVVTSVIVLDEGITWMSALGTALTLVGLYLSERK
ncbi:MAG: DMT family transporter [Spirochaetaceae bacterium]|jgi:drug/metabolite transporter (DMT)-like permease|nr:DMT family transporter [Spirochaetaceae bacterium]